MKFATAELLVIFEHPWRSSTHEPRHYQHANTTFRRSFPITTNDPERAADQMFSLWRRQLLADGFDLREDDGSHLWVAPRLIRGIGLSRVGITDPLHPEGRCTCAGEGQCDWCRRIDERTPDELGS